MKVADYIIQYIADQGIDKVFQVYGSASAMLLDAFTRVKNIRYVCGFHEQACTFFAEGWSKVTGKPGVCIATSSPGATNLITGLCNAYYDSWPLICITGNVNSKFMRPNKEVRQVGFQECPIVDVVKPITKYSVMLKDPTHVKYELQKCFYYATQNRQGSVLLDVPMDIQKSEIDPNMLDSFIPPEKEECSDIEIDLFCEKFICDLLSTPRPGLLVGNGVRGYIDKLWELTNLLKIPVYPTWSAIDIIADNHPYFSGRIGTYGGKGRNIAFQSSSLILSLACRMSGRISGGNITGFLREAKRYLVDIDTANTISSLQTIKCHENLLCDVGKFIDVLINKIKICNLPDFSKWLKESIRLRDKYDPVKEAMDRDKDFAHVHPYLFTRKLSQALNNDAICIIDCGGNACTWSHAAEHKLGQRFISDHGNSPMGFSICGAIGSSFGAKTNQQVICICGDGGTCVNLAELQLLSNYPELKTKIFIADNRAFGITLCYQRTNFPDSGEIACSKAGGYIPPDFVKLCRDGFGLKTFEIINNEQIDNIIKEVLAFDGACICVVRSDMFSNYYPRTPSFESPIEDQEPYNPDLPKDLAIPLSDFSKRIRGIENE